MPMPTTNGRLGADITKESASEYIRAFHERSLDSAPEIAAMTLMRHVDSWEEHSAILKALDAVLVDHGRAMRDQLGAV